MKKVTFNDVLQIHTIPDEDRINYEFYNSQRFQLRIIEFEKLFKKIYKKNLL